MSFVSDFTKPPEDVVIDLINFDNGTAFTSSTLLVVGAPASIPKSPPIFRNSEIMVKPSVTTKKHGTALLWYNRVDLASLPGLDSVLFDVNKDATMMSDVVPLINERYHINLTPNDYINTELPPLTTGAPRMVSLQAAPGSLVYVGELDILIEIDPGQGVPVSTIITNPYLNIFQFVRSAG